MVITLQYIVEKFEWYLRFPIWPKAGQGAKTRGCNRFDVWAMYLLDLPPELLIRVLDIATAIHPAPAHVLVLNKFIYWIASPILYRHLHLLSVSALARFPSVIWGSETVWQPSTITVKLAGGEVGRGAFRDLGRLLSGTRFPRDVNGSNALELENLHLCMHSTSDGDADDQSLQALEFVK